MKKKPSGKELKLPIFHDASPEAPELSMDDYYNAVMMLIRAMPPSTDRQVPSPERFVIREDDEPFDGPQPKS